MSEMKPTFQLCEVIEVYDDKGGDRIKVATAGDNYKGDKKNIEEWAFPLLPKIFHVKPKVGESVIVFLMNPDENNSQRFYLGPIITQPTHIYEEPYNNDSEAFFKGAYINADESPYMNPKMLGAFPENDDIEISGRRNCGLQITDNDIRLKAGVKRANINGNERDIEFNREDPAFIKLSYDSNKNIINPEDFRSSAIIVADKIALLGNNNGQTSSLVNSFKTDNSTIYKSVKGKNGKSETQYPNSSRELITDKEFENILDATQQMAYKLPYGEPLIEFLKMLRTAFRNHVHPFPTMQPCNTDEIKAVMNYDLDGILSNTVRIN